MIGVTLSVMPGNRRRSSMAADSSPSGEGGTDYSGLSLADAEHGWRMGTAVQADKPGAYAARSPTL
jgi:hypothetical protein